MNEIIKPKNWWVKPLVALLTLYALTGIFAILYSNEFGMGTTSGNLVIGIFMIICYTIGSILGKDIIMHEKFGWRATASVPVFWVLMIDWVFKIGFLF
ncbi:MAG: hypothetical protein VYB40_04420 [Candidatus Thermoplasmatota archaeon]|nr:hypothetical protein [Candidatus Thermoplasmatota archaeon]